MSYGKSLLTLKHMYCSLRIGYLLHTKYDVEEKSNTVSVVWLGLATLLSADLLGALLDFLILILFQQQY